MTASSATSRQLSEKLFDRAKNSIPGGVNSPVRAFGHVGGTPPFIAAGEGAYLIDLDGNRYIDYVGSWGPLILGHADPRVLASIEQRLSRGTTFGAPTEEEVMLAELVIELVPGMEMVRMVSSGTEAVMSALRLARAVTKRKYLITFAGCYHGHSDGVLVSAGSGVLTFAIPGSPGVPEEVAALTISVEYNNLEQLQKVLAEVGGENVAAIIIEPVVANAGLILPKPGFLQGLREICNAHGIVLIFDEVITGFRLALGGAQQRFQVIPDMTILGKILGGGLPAAAFGGKKEIMKELAPQGSVYQAGTLSGNPLAMVAGRRTLEILQQLDPYPALEERGERLATGLKEIATTFDIPLTAAHCGSLIGFFFIDGEVKSYQDLQRLHRERFRRFFHGMLEAGIYLAPSPYEVAFLSVLHTDQMLTQTLEAAQRVMSTMAADRI